MKKSVAYIRVSTENQASEGISLDNQKNKISAYANFNDMEIVEIIEDAGKSGKSMNRDGMQRLITLCKSKKIDAVIVYQFSRLTRSTKDLLFLVEDVFDKNDISFHSINEKVDTSTPQGKFFLTIIGAMNQMEREEIAFRTKDAMDAKRVKNERISGEAPYGYRFENGHVISDQNEQEIIALIKDMRLRNWSYKKIAEELNKKSLTNRRGSEWKPQYIHSIMKKAA